MRTICVVLAAAVIGLGGVAAAIVKGDANCDGRIGAADIAAIVTAIGVAEPACANADVDGEDGVTATDVAAELGIVFPPFEEFVATAEDFGCLLDLPQIRHIHVDNKLGHLEEALAIARAQSPLPYPSGTIIQLVPFEAMVKRGGNYDLDNDNWEYFFLGSEGTDTVVKVRGRDEVVNQFNANCFNCHSAARDFDFVCEQNHGCIKLPIGQAVIEALKRADSRCK